MDNTNVNHALKDVACVLTTNANTVSMDTSGTLGLVWKSAQWGRMLTITHRRVKNVVLDVCNVIQKGTASSVKIVRTKM